VRVWVTRAEPGAEATARRLRDLGHDPLVAPLLRIRFLSPPLDLTDVGALAFSSANGVAAFAALHPGRDLPVFAVGEATAAAASAAGFPVVLSADGDVRALAALIEAERGRLDGVVLHPAAAIRAGDLAGDLTARGVEARTLVVYEAEPVAPSAETLAELTTVDAVLAHSPRAAALLARIQQARGLPALCISDAAAAPLQAKGFSRVASASSPDEASLLALLDALPTAPARIPAVVWALLVFGLLCVIGGYGVARFGPSLFAAPEAAVQGGQAVAEPSHQ